MGEDMSAPHDASWRRWLEFQLQFKRHDTFVAMERTGNAPWHALDELRASLPSSHDVEVVNKAVDSHRKSGGSLRGGIYKALEALTQRYCPRGTRRKLQDEMDALHKHHDVTVDSYTESFHHLLDMYTLLSLQDGETLTTADVCKLYSNGMPREWQDRVAAEPHEDCTIGKLEAWFKRLEREEREEEELPSRKRRRAEYEYDDKPRDDDRSPRHYKRRFESPGCSYCREFRYGDAYKTHSDEQCHHNPKNNNSTCKHRLVPRGKMVAVFGPGVKKSDEEEQHHSHFRDDEPGKTGVACDPESRPSEASDDAVPANADAEREQRQQGHCSMRRGADYSNLEEPALTTVKVEPKSGDGDSKDPQSAVHGLSVKSSECSGLTSCPIKCSTEAPPKSSADTSSNPASTTPIKCLPDVRIQDPTAAPDGKLVKPFEEIELAMVGPFGQTDWCVLVFVDSATHFVELCPVVHATSAEITHAIDEEWLSRYPWPSRFVYSARVPAYDPAFSHLRRRCGGYGTVPVAEPAPPTSVLNVLLLQVHLIIELKVIEMQPQSHADWMSVVSVARLNLRTPSGTVVTVADPVMTKPIAELSTAKKVEQDPLYEQREDPANAMKTSTNDFQGSRLDFEFAPDDMVFVEYREMRRSVGPTPRREGPYRVEAVRTNGTLVIDKGKYLEQIHARRAVLVTR